MWGWARLVGIIAFSRVLSYLLKHYYDLTVALLVGFMAGSLWKIYPWKECLQSDRDRHGDFRCLLERNIAPDAGSDTFIGWRSFCWSPAFCWSIFWTICRSRANPIFRQIMALSPGAAASIALVWFRRPADDAGAHAPVPR